MRPWCFALLLACGSEEKPKQAVREVAHDTKEKALEVAQEAARKAQQAADVAIKQAEQAKQEMLAARDELDKTMAERAELKEQGKATIASARKKLEELGERSTRLAELVEAATKNVADAANDQARAAAQTALDELKAQQVRLGVHRDELTKMVNDLEKSLAQ